MSGCSAEQGARCRARSAPGLRESEPHREDGRKGRTDRQKEGKEEVKKATQLCVCLLCGDALWVVCSHGAVRATVRIFACIEEQLHHGDSARWILPVTTLPHLREGKEETRSFVLTLSVPFSRACLDKTIVLHTVSSRKVGWENSSALLTFSSSSPSVTGAAMCISSATCSIGAWLPIAWLMTSAW